MVIPYRTAKFKSANILPIVIWAQPPNFNSRQYFRLYGIVVYSTLIIIDSRYYYDIPHKRKQVPVSKFHELRYNVAFILKEMEDLEQRTILKVQD